MSRQIDQLTVRSLKSTIYTYYTP